jgi:hypothetical protein
MSIDITPACGKSFTQQPLKRFPYKAAIHPAHAGTMPERHGTPALCSPATGPSVRPEAYRDQAIVPYNDRFRQVRFPKVSNPQYGEQDLTGLSDSGSISVIPPYLKNECATVDAQNLSGLVIFRNCCLKV